MVATTYGHLTFFVSAQLHAGEIRASSVAPATATAPVLPATVSARGLADIASERARLTTQLLAARAQKCANACTAIALRQASLMAHIDALNIAADEARRHEAATDRQAAAQDCLAALRDSAMADPVTSRIARAVSSTTSTVDLCIALAFGMLLECVGCVNWLLALSHSETVPHFAIENEPAHAAVTASNVPVVAVAADGLRVGATQTSDRVTVTASNGVASAGNDAEHFPVTRPAPGAELAQLAAEIAAGRSRATVAEIRKYFRCSQAKVMALRRQFGEAMQELARSG